MKKTFSTLAVTAAMGFLGTGCVAVDDGYGYYEETTPVYYTQPVYTAPTTYVETVVVEPAYPVHPPLGRPRIRHDHRHDVHRPAPRPQPRHKQRHVAARPPNANPAAGHGSAPKPAAEKPAQPKAVYTHGSSAAGRKSALGSHAREDGLRRSTRPSPVVNSKPAAAASKPAASKPAATAKPAGSAGKSSPYRHGGSSGHSHSSGHSGKRR